MCERAVVGLAMAREYPAETWLTPPQRGEGDGVPTRSGIAASLTVSVHGAAGIVDLVVPAGATSADVAAEYARQAGLGSAPVLRTRLGRSLAPDVPLTQAGVVAGALLVAATAADPDGPDLPARARSAEPRGRPGALAALWCCVAAAAAVLAGWCAARTSSEVAQTVTVDLLVAGAVLGVLPVGRLAAHRVLAAPAFAGAAALALAWDPHPERQPMVLGVAGLAAAVTAAVGRSLDRRSEEALRVWVVAGATVFAGAGLGALAGAPPRVAWAVLLIAAVLAARFVPGLAVDVPDQYLLDLERLAVTAWSAREQPAGRRGRSVVPLGAVTAVATRGARTVTAASAAVLVAALVSAPLLLATATLPIDRMGARCLVGFAGAGLLLAARSHRHTAARALLRTAGIGCEVVLAVALLGAMAERGATWLAVTALAVAAGLVVVAVALGRGWRSAWWSRRAEVAEGLSGALALAAVVVATGAFRELWELASLWELGS